MEKLDKNMNIIVLKNEAWFKVIILSLGYYNNHILIIIV